MCFSTSASFASATILTVIGIATLKKTKVRSHIMFACIPLIFAIQQLSEGLVWLSLTHETKLISQQLAINFFLVFALIIWPSWIPLATLTLEKNHTRRIILAVFSGMGLIFSILSIYYLIAFHSGAEITPYHIHYYLSIPEDGKIILGFLYLVPTVLSTFVSSIKKLPIIGISVLISYLITKIFFADYVVSVWCFFAAIISITIYFILSDKPDEKIFSGNK